jgi:hypothetical protein
VTPPVVVYTCNLSYSKSKAGSGKSVRPYQKQTKTKRGGRALAQYWKKEMKEI